MGNANVARGSLPQIYKKRVKLPIFDASNVHSRASGFVCVPVHQCFRAIYRAKKRNTKKKVLTLAQKSPQKEEKRGAFRQKLRTCAHRSAFRLRNSPSTASSAPLSPLRSHVCPISPHLHLPVRAVFSLTPHVATRNAPAVPARKDVRLELHAPMPEDTPFTDANSGRTQRMIEKQTRKCHKKRTRARVRRFEPRKRARKTSTAFCGMPKDGREMIEQYHSSTQGHVLTSQAAISAREETAQNYYLCATYGNYTH